MNWQLTNYEASFGTAEQLPVSDLPEICFSGRSNVGKSSLLNRLVGRKALARVSTKPGKTVTINFFRNDAVRLVDLPGYGYAKVPFAEKDRWSGLMEAYFSGQRNLRLVCQLVDIRHDLSDFDRTMLTFIAHHRLPCAVILTKRDKLNQTEFALRTDSLTKDIHSFLPNAAVLPFSAFSGDGLEPIRSCIIEHL